MATALRDVTLDVMPFSRLTLTVVVDRAHARFFEVKPAGAVELGSLHAPAMRGSKFPGDPGGGPEWGEYDHPGRIREEERRYYGTVANRLAELLRLQPTAAIVLAGSGIAAGALERFLPPAVREQVIGTARVDATEISAEAVHRAATRLREEHEADVTRALIVEVCEGLGTGWAENGTRAVLSALARGQVRTLLIRSDTRGTGFRCAGSGRLVLSATDCRGEGDPVPVPDVVGEAIKEAERQDVAVVEVRDPAAAQVIDGLAAILRFR